jgi:hypothetical protein
MELLEAIGQDATLRHASSGALADMLEAADASEALKAAVASGDSAWLSQEFGTMVMHGSQTSQTGYEEEEPKRKEGEEPTAPVEPETPASD